MAKVTNQDSGVVPGAIDVSRRTTVKGTGAGSAGSALARRKQAGVRAKKLAAAAGKQSRAKKAPAKKAPGTRQAPAKKAPGKSRPAKRA